MGISHAEQTVSVSVGHMLAKGLPQETSIARNTRGAGGKMIKRQKDMRVSPFVDTVRDRSKWRRQQVPSPGGEVSKARAKADAPTGTAK
jgi:hypothetical protein